MNKIPQHSVFRSLTNLENVYAAPVPLAAKRKQILMRCGLKFYFVYEDDGSLVDDEDIDVPVVQRYRP